VNKLAPHLASLALVCIGLLMLGVAAVAVFSTTSNGQSITSMIVMGALLVILGALLPRLADDFEVGPKGLKAKLKGLSKTVTQAEQEIPPATEPIMISKTKTYSTDQITEQILQEASSSPRAALIHLGVIIERQTRLLLAKTNWIKPSPHLNFSAIISYLEERKFVSVNLTSSLRMFWDVRNDLVHSSEDQNDEDILRAIDIGLTILKMIDGIPHERNVVYHPGVDVFEDEECKIKRPNILGVILDTTSPGGAIKQKRIFPTTRSYKKSQELSWEWNFDIILGESWYREPDTKEIKSAWGSSAEFIGRPLEEVV